MTTEICMIVKYGPANDFTYFQAEKQLMNEQFNESVNTQKGL